MTSTMRPEIMGRNVLISRVSTPQMLGLGVMQKTTWPVSCW